MSMLYKVPKRATTLEKYFQSIWLDIDFMPAINWREAPWSSGEHRGLTV